MTRSPVKMYDTLTQPFLLLLPFLLVALNYFLRKILQKVATRCIPPPVPPAKLVALLQELKLIDARDELARHLLLKREINALKASHGLKVSEHFNTRQKGDMICGFLSRLLMIVATLSTFWLCSSTPVIILKEDWLNWPLSRLVTYPVAIPGAVSFHCWYLMCSRVVGLIKT